MTVKSRERQWRVQNDSEGLLQKCSILKEAQSKDDSGWSMHGNFIVKAFSSRDHDRQTLHQTTHSSYAQWLRLLQVRGMHKLHSRDSAHDLGVTLSPCMCSHSSCPDWQVVEQAWLRTLDWTCRLNYGLDCGLTFGLIHNFSLNISAENHCLAYNRGSAALYIYCNWHCGVSLSEQSRAYSVLWLTKSLFLLPDYSIQVMHVRI